MVQMRKVNDPNIRLVIAPEAVSSNQEPNLDEFKQLANDIMEEFPEEDCDSSSDSGTTACDGPTFTYPSQCGEYDQTTDEPWNTLLNLLSTNNRHVIGLLDSIGISPDVSSVGDFYYSNFDPSSDRYHDWKCIDSLNTILSDDRFASMCIDSGFRSA